MPTVVASTAVSSTMSSGVAVGTLKRPSAPRSTGVLMPFTVAATVMPSARRPTVKVSGWPVVHLYIHVGVDVAVPERGVGVVVPRTVRLKHAAELLRSHRHSVTEVSELVGYNTPRYFTKHFKDMYGVTPSEYK